MACNEDDGISALWTHLIPLNNEQFYERINFRKLQSVAFSEQIIREGELESKAICSFLACNVDKFAHSCQPEQESSIYVYDGE